MANPADHKTPPRTRVAVHSLLSPPEMKRSESFGSSIAGMPPSHNSTCGSTSSMSAEKTNPAMTKLPAGPIYNTPPISPQSSFSNQKDGVECSSNEGVRDPQLFVSIDDASPVSNVPLFSQPQEPALSPMNKAITTHMESPEYANLQHKPARADYELVCAVVQPTVYDEYNKDPKRWFAQEREFERYYGKPTGVQKRPTPQKPKNLAPAPSSHHKEKVAIPRLPRAPQAPRRTPKARKHDSMDLDSDLHLMGQMTADPPKPARAKKVEEVADFRLLPDYCPPIETLGGRALKADWKNTPSIDVTKDPESKYMHSEEIKLATTLRLPAKTYLCSKRHIFAARVEALKKGKDFRRTDAQKACKIDVNKASKLYQAFDKVGWFDPKYYLQFMGEFAPSSSSQSPHK